MTVDPIVLFCREPTISPVAIDDGVVVMVGISAVDTDAMIVSVLLH